MGNNVRRRKSRRKARVSSTRQSQKLKKKQTKKCRFELGLLRDRWDQRKTLKQNLDSLGLAYDSNTAIPIQSGQQTKQDEVGELADYTKPADDGVADKAALGDSSLIDTRKKKNHRMSRSDVKFITDMIKSHGTNYKGMVRDSRNYNQLTEAQIKRKCKHYLSSIQDTPRDE